MMDHSDEEDWFIFRACSIKWRPCKLLWCKEVDEETMCGHSTRMTTATLKSMTDLSPVSSSQINFWNKFCTLQDLNPGHPSCVWCLTVVFQPKKTCTTASAHAHDIWLLMTESLIAILECHMTDHMTSSPVILYWHWVDTATWYRRFKDYDKMMSFHLMY